MTEKQPSQSLLSLRSTRRAPGRRSWFGSGKATARPGRRPADAWNRDDMAHPFAALLLVPFRSRLSVRLEALCALRSK